MQFSKPTLMFCICTALAAQTRHRCPSGKCTTSDIKHLIVIVQENHSFDSYFGRYCQAPENSNPLCTVGPFCCERGPDKQPGPLVEYWAHELSDSDNKASDRNHLQDCELSEMHGGKMDWFAWGVEHDKYGKPCSSAQNFRYATQDVAGYWDLAKWSSLADRYFQPIAGASTSNDIYFARAGFLFTDNPGPPAGAVGSICAGGNTYAAQDKTTIADLLFNAGWTFTIYLEGYKHMAAASPGCPKGPPECPSDKYPCVYDPGDNPFAYFKNRQNDPKQNKDLASLFSDIDNKNLPSVSFVRSLGYKSEHPAASTISTGAAFVWSILQKVDGSSYANNTLLLVTWDESGGFFDHVKPPDPNQGDYKPYGPRVPLLAYGRFALTNHVSHVEMEHSSIVKFIEWNWLNGQTSQLHTRDAHVNNIGSMLDSGLTGVPVPLN